MARRSNPQPQRRGKRNIDVYINWATALINASKTRCVVAQTKQAKEELQKLGVKNVHCWHGKAYAMVDKLCKLDKEVLLIFNTDRNSNAKCQKVRSLLEREGLKVSTRFRKLLFTSQLKTLSGMIKFVRQQIAQTPRRLEATPYSRGMSEKVR